MGLNVKVDVEEATAIVTRFIHDTVAAAQAQGVVIGLSGGIDSAVVACLAARALGPERVHAFFLPSDVSSEQDRQDAVGAARTAGITLHSVDIGAAVDTTLGALARPELVHEGPHGLRSTPPAAQGAGKTERANAMARVRMIALYTMAQRHGMMVLGTGNKSEALVGYFTKHGDGGVDLQPVGDLYKTQVFELARHLGLPEPLVTKPPSAGLWEGQTDEQELGLTYETLDQILLGLEIGLAHERIAAEVGVERSEVERIETRRRRTQHKRRMPLMPKLGIRTTSTDWRDPVMGTAPASG